MNKTVAVLPGDGIGPEVMEQALSVLEIVAKKYNLSLTLNHADVGGMAYDKHGTSLPKETMDICTSADAILFGSVGGPKWDKLPPEEKIERVALLGLRKHFKFYANLRPATVYPALSHLCPLRADIAQQGFDIMVLRELTGGIYFGKHELHDDWASDEMKYTVSEVQRIAKKAFEIAMTRKKQVTCVDKSNVLSSSVLFRRVVDEVAKDFPQVTLDYLYVDNATMQLIKQPSSFDVIVTTNMFGDILSDEAAMLTGSIGMLPSASINEQGFALYEPAGGSAPDIAGKGVANPIAQIMCVAMMLKYSFGLHEAYDDIQQAVQTVLGQGKGTGDLQAQHTLSTKELGDEILSAL